MVDKHMSYFNLLDAHEPIIMQKDFDEVQRRLARNRKNSVVRFKDNIYHFSGVLKCNECGRPYRGKMVTVNRKKKYKRAWYYCASRGHYYMKCSNKAVTADSISKQAWDIIDIISNNLHVLEELGDTIKIAAIEPEECYIEQLREKEKLLAKNLENQKDLYNIYSEDRMNVDVYRDKADELRKAEKKLKRNMKEIQMEILKKRNSINVVKETQDFLIGLRNTSEEEQSDYMIKTFMRIIFQDIYVHNQEIVKLEINQPWKLCYEEGMKWIKTMEKELKSTKKDKRSYVSFCVPSDGRWPRYSRTMVSLAEALVE